MDRSTAGPGPQPPDPPTEPVPPPPTERSSAPLIPAPVPAAPPAAPPVPPLYVPPPPPAAWPAVAPVGEAPRPPVAWEVPPTRDGIAVPGAPELVYAGTMPRALAYIIDGLVLLVLAIVLGIVVGLIAATVALSVGGQVGSPAVATAIGATGFVLLDMVYFVVLWTGRRRATFGMRLLHLQVGNAADGRTLTGEQAVRRWIGYGRWLTVLAIAPAMATTANLIAFVWLIVLLASVAIDATHQGLHDRFAGSAVVRTRGSSNTMVVGCLVLIGFVVFVSLVSIVALIFLGVQVSTTQSR